MQIHLHQNQYQKKGGIKKMKNPFMQCFYKVGEGIECWLLRHLDCQPLF